MREELITFPTAKLAKEKEFDIFSPMMYRDGKLCGTKMDMHGNPNAYLDCYSAPTQSLLQRWLREVHNIKVDVKSGTHNGNKEWVDWYCSVNNANIIDHRDGLDTYEEALEQGLIEALKLIK